MCVCVLGWTNRLWVKLFHRWNWWALYIYYINRFRSQQQKNCWKVKYYENSHLLEGTQRPFLLCYDIHIHYSFIPEYYRAARIYSWVLNQNYYCTSSRLLFFSNGPRQTECIEKKKSCFYCSAYKSTNIVIHIKHGWCGCYALDRIHSYHLLHMLLCTWSW